MDRATVSPLLRLGILSFSLGILACGDASDHESAPELAGAAAAEDRGTAGEADTDTTTPAAPANEDTRLFRLTEIKLRDPHLFLDVTDITDEPFLTVSVNGSLLKNGLEMDYDGDGFLDVSILVALKPRTPALDSGELHVVDGQCPVATPDRCAVHTAPTLDTTWKLSSPSDGPCLKPIEESTSDFDPPVELPAKPCFVGDKGESLVVNLAGILLTLSKVRISARLDDSSSAGQLVDGLIMGFMSDEAASDAKLPSYLPLVAGESITSFLRDEDRDMDGETSGWWLYLNFVADPVETLSP